MKMVSIKSVASITLALALTGCAGKYQNTDVNTEASELQKKAIVITNMNVPLKTKSLLGNDRDFPLQSYWHRVDGTVGEKQLKYNFGRTGLFSAGDTGAYHEHMVEPGTYELDELAYTVSGSRLIETYSMKMTTKPKISFTVNAGEIVYIGDIQAGQGLRKIKFNDTYDKAVAYFKSAHPEINIPIQKKPLITPASFDKVIESLKEKIKLLEEAKKIKDKK